MAHLPLSPSTPTFSKVPYTEMSLGIDPAAIYSGQEFAGYPFGQRQTPPADYPHFPGRFFPGEYEAALHLGARLPTSNGYREASRPPRRVRGARVTKHNEGKKEKKPVKKPVRQKKTPPKENKKPAESPAEKLKRMEATLAKESIFVPHPLTVVAVEKATVPVFDVNKYVRRPAEERHLEVQEGKKVKRPLNAFLLYRKTYQHVAHSLCEKKNHQHISIICAVSWRKESPETLAMFKGLAEIDSQKHLEAYPGYRYAPRKNDGSRDTDCEDDEMDVDDGDTRHVPAMESTPLHPADMMPLYDSSVDNAYLTSAIGPGDFPLMSQPPGAYYPCYYENGPLVYEQPSGSIPRTAGCPTISYPEPPVESSTGPMTSGFDPCLYSAWAGDAGSQANNDLQASHQMQGVVPSWSILSSYSELGSQTNHWLGDSQQWDQKPLTDTVSVAEFLYQC